MTGAAREKDQADFDLERFIEMFDEALTSKDERVVNALRSLMMISILTKSETYGSPAKDKSHGPLRRLYEDVHHLNRRLHQAEDEINGLRARLPNEDYAKEISVNNLVEPNYGLWGMTTPGKMIGAFGPGAVGSPSQVMRQPSPLGMQEAINKINQKTLNPKVKKEK